MTKVLSIPEVYGSHKRWYTIRILTNVAARDTNEYVVKRILKHDFTDPNKKLWLVQWQLDGDEDETWEPFEDVEAFHHYCAANGLSTLFPKQHPVFAHINRSQREHKRQLEPPLTTTALSHQALTPKKFRGSPSKAPVSPLKRRSPLKIHNAFFLRGGFNQ